MATAENTEDETPKTDSELNLLKLRTRTQYYATIIVNLGALGLGTVIGWSSPSEQLVQELTNATDTQISWVSSIMPLGAASSQIVMAFLIRIISCKYLIIILNGALALSWLLLAFSKNLILFYTGRFLTGFFAATNCITVPIFVGEFSHKSVRGRMGTFFQLLIVFGILLMYCLGESRSLLLMALVPLVVSASLIAPTFFLPESPVHSVKKGKTEAAQKALKFFRGPTYKIDKEMEELAVYATDKSDEKFSAVIKQRPSVNAILILVVLHCVQQLSGINAFMFYAKRIFENAGSSLTPGISAIVMAVVQMLVTGVAALVVDKIGRKILMVASLAIMAATNVMLGTYMLLSKTSPDSVEDVQFLPVIILSVYIIGFGLGTGPIPWALLGEMVPDRIKFIVNTGVACLNWILAFVVTVSFDPLQQIVGSYTVFYIYGGVCALGILFVIACVIETKNKTLEEIQVALSNKKNIR